MSMTVKDKEKGDLIADLIANAPRDDKQIFKRRLMHSCGHKANVTMWGSYRLDDRFKHASQNPCCACMTYQSGINCEHYTHKTCSLSTISAIMFMIERDDITG